LLKAIVPVVAQADNWGNLGEAATYVSEYLNMTFVDGSGITETLRHISGAKLCISCHLLTS